MNNLRIIFYIVNKINLTLRTVLQDKEFVEKFVSPLGYVTIGSTPNELAEYLNKDRSRQSERIKASGAEMN
jgi:tripartite-type tricarboxylate transporter receptor subunit TctC